MILFIIHFNLTVLLLFCDRTFPFQNMKLRDDEKGESWPISRVLSRMIIPLGAQSPVRSCILPASSAGHANGCLFGLASSGVYPAAPVASCAVRSYRTFSPLPAWRINTKHRRFSSLLHFPSAYAA